MRAPSARWRALLDASDRALGDHLADAALALRGRRRELAVWAALADLPEAEVCASPFGARMIALGLAAGATGVQHELRPLLLWDRALLPPDAVADPAHGTWQRGALRTGKYQEFCQEEPFCAYHPEHSSKWAPHEHLHRAVGFLHRERASGFERYVGARLNELLPVASWYGLEEALRLDRDGPFDRAREGREPGASLERARWLVEPERALRRRARAAAPLVRWTLDRAASELDAIDRELATGMIVPSADAGAETFAGVRLDASSDALAYVHAHGGRLRSPHVSRVLGALAANRRTDVRSLRAHVERVLDALLFAPLRLDPRRVERRILASVLHDAFLRAATRGDSMFRACASLLPRAGRLAQSLRGAARLPNSAERVRALLDELERRLVSVEGKHGARAIVTLGLRAPLRSVSTVALSRGLRASVPVTHARLARSGRRALVSALAADREHSRLLLPERVALHLRALDGLAVLERRALADLARLEHALDTVGGLEPRTAWATPLRGAPTTSKVVRDARTSILSFATDVFAAHRGEPFVERAVSVVVVRTGAEHGLVETSAALADLIEPLDVRALTLRQLRARAGIAAVRALVELGVLLVLPPLGHRGSAPTR